MWEIQQWWALNCKPKRSLNWCYFSKRIHIWWSTIKWNYISHFCYWKLWSSSNKGFSSHFKWPQRITKLIRGQDWTEQNKTEATATATVHFHRCNFCFSVDWRLDGFISCATCFVIWSQAKHTKKCSIIKQLNQQQH